MLLRKKTLSVRIISLNLFLLFSTFLFQTCSSDGDSPVAPPGGSLIISKLDTTINVDMADAIISYEENVSLLIPQGTVSGDTKLIIAKLDDNSTPVDEEMEFPNAYEITLGDQHVFDKPLEISLKYDPEKLNEGIFKYKIGAAYYDETLNKWALFKSVSVDTLLNTVSFATNHLTKLSWYHLKYAYGYTDYLNSPHFTIYWVDGKVVSDADYKSSLTNHKGTAPHYVQDILYYLEESWEAYKKNKLEVPEDTTDKVEVRVLELPVGEDGNTSFFGFVRISQNIKASSNMSQEDVVKITCAHEFLHYVQDYYFMQFGAGNFTKWWLEVTAVQADRIVWPNNSQFEAINYADGQIDGQLERSWDDCNSDPNYYIAGGFLTYLTSYRSGPKLSIPKIIFETGKATNISYFRTILNDYLKNNLSSYGIGHEYRDYVKWAYEHKGPINIKYIPPLSSTNAKYVVPVRLSEDNASWNATVTVPYLAAKMVKIISPTSTGTSSFEIVLNSGDTQLQYYVYISNKDQTTYKKYLIKNDTLKIDLESKNQWIDILSCNIFKDDNGSFDLSVKLIQGPTITSITPSSAPVGAIVQIKGSDFGSTQNNSELWFGEVKALASDIVSWLGTQIEVKVPEGAVSGDVHVSVDKVTSNKIFFTVEGAPVITEIYDSQYKRDFQVIHRFTLPNNTAEIIGQNFGDHPQIRKVYVNNIEAEIYNWSDTLIQFKLPEQPTGNISVQLTTSTGTSNEFSYFSGLPLSYLTTTNSLGYNLSIIVNFTHIGLGGEGRNDWYTVGCMSDPTYSGEIATKDAFSWSNNTLIIDISKKDPTLNGILKCTFSSDGVNIEKLELDYVNSENGLEEVHYVGENIPYRNYEGNYYTNDLLGVTTSLSGQISSFLNGEEVGRTDIIGINTSAGYGNIFLELSF